MRLINTRTLSLQEFVGRPPPYAILSHTWSRREISLQDYRAGLVRDCNKDGNKDFSKIAATCKRAREQGLEYAWVDTCCINKSSSSELEEAINSMFKWYRNAEVCYAFLEDFKCGQVQNSIGNATQLGFGHCRWFTRGWTLQELIAPKVVEFYDSEWHKVAEKEKDAAELRVITGIDEFILKGGPLHEVSVGKRMSWAAGRKTTREEDTAYGLLGLFGVNMPLIYGEGSKAFRRLQEQILNKTADGTLFAWRASPLSAIENPARGLLAVSPDEFWNFSSKSDGTVKDNLIPVWDTKFIRTPITQSNRGIRITSRVQDLRVAWAPGDLLVLILHCGPSGDTERAAGIYLRRQAEDRYARIRTDELADVRAEGRHVAIKTLHGLASIMDVDGLPYDQPWTTPYKLRRDMLDDHALGHTLQSTKSLCSHAFFLDSGSVNTRSIFGKYSVRGVLIAGKGRTMYSFRYSPREIKPDMILRTQARLKAAITLRSDEHTDIILVLLTTKAPSASRDDPSTWNHSFDVVRVTQAQLDADKTLLSNILHETNCEHGLNAEKSISVLNKKLHLRVRLRPVTVEGLPMQRISIHGPWPASPREWLDALLFGASKGLVSFAAVSLYCSFAAYFGYFLHGWSGVG
ncbi:putative het domain-containing protein [Rosellinia necatrix]|uniref:Putative het domain-containing protein n=1 Tax=Rosellinia necatrix TaxID=77044 RepID=A0A1W2TIC1_ROSNE|nr:putative het domain-containing protein [Rosellinia necatrix]